jgi:hypothetical protein
MTKRKAKIIKDPKLRGEWVESVFMERAGAQGLAVSRPWGDSKSFDFVVGKPGKFVGVQVKSTTAEEGGGYLCCIRGRGNKAYARGSFDFLAAYVVPEDVWYIIPAEKVAAKESIALCSQSKHAKFEEYREAWHLLREASAAGDEQPSAEDAAESDPVARKEVQAAKFPTNAVERFQSAGNFFRRYMEGKHPRGDKDVEEL